ncbi:MAG: permease prefix domain 1-containing protein [Jatrophihabitantaceae bacterium]
MNDANQSPIEDYLDDLLRHTHTDARSTRRLLDEANDHLYAAAGQHQAAGMTRVESEREAVRSLGPRSNLTRGSWQRSFKSLVLEVMRAAILLGGCGLVAVGLSGGIAAVMNALAGDSFVGAATVLGVGGHSVAEAAQDAVSLRALAGFVGLAVLACYTLARPRTQTATVLPEGLTDALGAAAFAAATVALTGATIDQAVTGTAGRGVGFFLSGTLASLAGAVIFCTRATHALIPSRHRPTAEATPAPR